MTVDASTETSVCGVRLSHPGRVLFPQQGTTKLELAHYYEKASKLILPHVAARPLTLVRCPDGRGKECFFQKHANTAVPDAIERVAIREKSGRSVDYMVVTSTAGLVATAQIGALELHVWGARTDRLDYPGRIVFDLDPDEGLAFKKVRDAAFRLKERLDSEGLRSFPLLTGGKGIHVIVPLRRTRPWKDVKDFAKGLSVKIAEAEPADFVATPSKAARTGKIYIDWLRNERGATAIAPYSPRARPGAPVATPVNWNELAACKASGKYTLGNISTRLEAAEHVWTDYSTLRQSITKAHLASVAD